MNDSTLRRAARMKDAPAPDEIASVEALLRQGVTSMRPRYAQIARAVFGRDDVVDGPDLDSFVDRLNQGIDRTDGAGEEQA